MAAHSKKHPPIRLRQIYWRYRATIVMAIPLLGCGHTFVTQLYPGPALPAESLAVVSAPEKKPHWPIVTSSDFEIAGVALLELDGKSVDPDNVRTYAILPGIHTLRVQARAGFKEGRWHAYRWTPECFLTFEAKAGGNYYLESTRNDEWHDCTSPENGVAVCHLWILDMGSNQYNAYARQRPPLIQRLSLLGSSVSDPTTAHNTTDSTGAGGTQDVAYPHPVKGCMFNYHLTVDPIDFRLGVQIDFSDPQPSY